MLVFLTDGLVALFQQVSFFSKKEDQVLYTATQIISLLSGIARL